MNRCNQQEINGGISTRGSYVSLPGTSGNYASTPDAAQLDVLGDISLMAYLSLADWTPAANANILGKNVATGNQRSYILGVVPTGKLRINWTTDGINNIEVQSTVAPTITDGSPLAIMATLDVDNGSVGNTATFYTSPDGSVWTMLGTPVITAGVTSIFSSTAPLEVGSVNVGTAGLFAGKVYRAQVYNGLYFGTKTLVADFNPRATTRGRTTFTDSTGLPWTINGTATINP